MTESDNKSREEVLYQQAEAALNSYADTAATLAQQKDAAASLLRQTEKTIGRGEDLYRKLLEQRRRVEKLTRDTETLCQAVNRDCQGLRDSLELDRQNTSQTLAQISATTHSSLARIEKEMLQHKTACSRRLLWVTLLAGTAFALLVLLVVL